MDTILGSFQGDRDRHSREPDGQPVEGSPRLPSVRFGLCETWST